MSNPVTFTTSGTVQAQDGTYLTRAADEELFQLCHQGEYAYVLTSRQMGKSSLMVATAERLQGEGIQTAIADLQRLGAQTTDANSWYLGVLTVLARKLRILPQLMSWWEDNAGLGATQRFVQFIEDLVLPRVTERLVVFIDEIDSTLSLDFTDDFFIALRYCSTARAENPDFRKLSFVLIGVATPSELIRDQKRTPFNIGTLVELRDFDEAEAMPLAAGLGLPEAEAQRVLRWVLAWTGGHPYLTQRVCGEIVQQGRQDWAEADVAALIEQLFFGEQREQDNNLQFVQSMLTGRAPEADVLGVLSTYRAIRRDRQAIYDEDHSIVKAHLKLSGVVKRVGSVLHVRNAIYWEVFGPGWIREQWPENWWQRLKPAMPLIGGLTAVALGLGTLSVYALEQRNEARIQAARAEDALAKADIERKNALDAQVEAEEQAAEADAAKVDADKQRLAAEEAKDEADGQRLAAEEAKVDADEQRLRAEKEEAIANQQAEIAITQTRVAEESAHVARIATQNAEIAALNAEIRSDSLTVENLIASDLNFKALLAAIRLGRRVKQEECCGHVHPDVSLQAATVLREVSHLDGYWEKNTLIGHLSDIESVSFSPNGQFIASAGEDTIVRLWNLQSDEVILLEGHTLKVTSVSFSPDGQTIVSSSLDNTVRRWNLQGMELQSVQGFQSSSTSFSPDGQTLAIFGANDDITLWHFQSGEMETVPVNIENINNVSFSPDGRLIAFSSFDGTINLWNHQKNELLTLQEAQENTLITSITFSPVRFQTSYGLEYVLASSSNDSTVKLWDLQGNQLGILRGHTSIVWDVDFSYDGQTIASASFDGSIKLWDLQGRNFQTLKGHTGFIKSLDFSPSHEKLVSGSSDATVKVWELKRTEQKILESHRQGITRISFSPSGQLLASSSHDGTINLWDLNDQNVKTFEGHSESISNPNTFTVWDVSFSPDGKTIASVGVDGTVRLWDLHGNELLVLRGHSTPLRSVSFSPDGQKLISSGGEGVIKLWNIQGRELRNFTHAGWVMDVSFSPNGQLIASASSDGTVKLWDLQGNKLQLLEGHTSTVRSVNFSPDSANIITASTDGTLRLWNLKGEELQVFQGHTSWVLNADFSPNGKIVISSGSDHTVKLWDLQGNQLQTLEGHLDGVSTAQFSPDGQTLASGSDDRTIILWNLNLDDLLTKSCAWLRDYMANPATPAEHKALCPSESGVSPLSQLQGAGVAHTFLHQLLTQNPS